MDGRLDGLRNNYPNLIETIQTITSNMNAELQLILDMSRRAEEAGKVVEFNEEATRLQYEDWNMSRLDAMRKALIKVLDEK